MNDMKTMHLLLIVVLPSLMNLPVESTELSTGATQPIAVETQSRSPAASSRNCPVEHCLLLMGSKAPLTEVESISKSNVGLLRDILLVRRCVEAEERRCAAGQADGVVNEDCPTTMCGGQAADADCIRRHCAGGAARTHQGPSSTSDRHRRVIVAGLVDESCRKSCALLATGKEEECIKKFCAPKGNEVWSKHQATGNDDGDVDIIDGDASADRSSKRWGNRIGRRNGKGLASTGSDEDSDGGMEDVVDSEEEAHSQEAGRTSKFVKRWGSRVCIEAHCRSYEKNRSAFVACGQRFCGRRRR